MVPISHLPGAMSSAAELDRDGAIRMVTLCRLCGSRVPINGPVRATTCPQCLALVELQPDCIVDALLSFEEAFAKLAVNLAGKSLDCPHCGHEVPVRVTPKLLQDELFGVTHLLGVDPVEDDEPERTPELEVGCPQCTARFAIPPGASRLVRCCVCKARIYLPESTWRPLEASRVVRPWTLVYDAPILETKRDRENRLEQEQREEEKRRQDREREATEQKQREAMQRQEEARLDEQRRQERVNARRTRRLMIIFGVLLPVLGVAGAVITAVEHHLSLEEGARYRAITARIERSRVVPLDNGNGYVPDFRYMYQVAGRTYHGRRYCLEGRGAGKDKLAFRDLLIRYPKGAQVTAYYDPRDPTQAVLSRNVDSTGRDSIAIVGSLMLVGGIVLLIFGLRKRIPSDLKA
ncbi:MAG: DUF3592 domain-containing protein [Anaerolineae bacterium]